MAYYLLINLSSTYLMYWALFLILTLLTPFGTSADIQCGVENCQTCITPNFCGVCQPNFIIEINSLGQTICTAINCDIQNCLGCTSENICGFCQPGYILSIDSSGNTICLIQPPTNCTLPYCLECLEDNYCSSCQNYYTPLNGTCECLPPFMNQVVENVTVCACPINATCFDCNIENCVNCTDTDVCGSCMQGYTLYDAFYCMPCNITNCVFCQNIDYCTECSQGLTSNSEGTECISCNISSCDLCSDPQTCVLCLEGYDLSLDQTSCVLCDVEDCNFCSSNNVCAQCYDGYELDGSGGCYLCTEPCETCNLAGDCQTCMDPFSMTAFEGECYLCNVADCLGCNYQNTSQCVNCSFGFNNVNGACVETCTTDNCQTCGTQINPQTDEIGCAVCLTFYSLGTDGNCYPCTNAPACLVCAQSNLNQCTKCNSGYFLSSGTCLPCASFCASCTSNTVCLVLKQPIGFVLINGGTVVAPCNVGCNVCSSNNPNSCITCANGFAVVNGNCIPCTYPCQTCAATNPTQCTSCYPASYLVNKACVGCNSTCLTCLSTNVQICTTCPPGFALINGKCTTPCPTNCINCVNATFCTSCVDGYAANTTGLCQPCMSTCKKCSGITVPICLQCGGGFYLNNGTCSMCPNMCSSCTGVGTSVPCQTCYPGFSLTPSYTCVAICVAPCSTCSTSDPTRCNSCLAGYSYNPNTFSCANITTCVGGCSVCPFGYILNSQQCLACSSNCARCQAVKSLSVCTACFPGAYLSGNVCINCPSPCLYCNTPQVCTGCLTGFTFQITAAAATPVCVQCVSPCATCAGQPNICTSCVQSYQLDGWKCVTTFNLGFSLTMNIAFNTFFTSDNYVPFLMFIQNLAGVPSVSMITMNNMTSGSTSGGGSVTMTVNPSSSAATNSMAGLTNGLKTGASINGIPVLSSNVITNGGTITPANNNSSSAPNLALILGITIPLVVIIIIGISILIYLKYKKRSDIIEEKIRQQQLTVRRTLELTQINNDQTDRRIEII